MKCRKCGTLNFDNALHCSNCNYELNPESSNQQSINRKPTKTAGTLFYFSVLMATIGIVAAIVIPAYHENTKTDLNLLKTVQAPTYDSGPSSMSEKSIISKKALTTYRNVYKNAKPHKAFAQSDTGAWAYRYGENSRQKATSTTLDNCKKFNKGKPSRIINVNNEWVN